MKNIVFVFIILISSISFAQDFYFVEAKNGLIVREAPSLKANKITKLSNGKKVTVINKTGVALTILDNQTKLTGEWYKVDISNHKNVSKKVGYVFNRYLNDSYGLESISNTIKVIHKNNDSIVLSEVTKKEFMAIPNSTKSNVLLDEIEAKKAGYISSNSEKEFTLKLTDGSQFLLKKEEKDIDEQFYGYVFKYYNTTLEVYVFWENWFEAGHPILINAKNGAIKKMVGEKISLNPDQTIFASYAVDLESGWTANGIQILEISTNDIIERFQIDPLEILNEYWGPEAIKWQDAATLIMKCRTDKGVFIYKKLVFTKNTNSPKN